MNREQANEIRASIGLPALPPVPKVKKNGNAAVRAQANRDLKAKRSKGGK